MKQYFFDIQIKSFYSAQRHRITAASKPRTDAIKIAQRCGFKTCIFYWLESENNTFLKSHPFFPNRVLRFQTDLFVLFTSGATILAQMPFLWRNMHEVLRRLCRKNKLIILVHDIDILRGSANAKDDLETLNAAHIIVCHTPQMAMQLRELGVTRPCVNLEFFDYLNSCEREEKDICNVCPDILFAGNLEKSLFVNSLDTVHHLDEMSFSLYGRGGRDFSLARIKYRGTFDNDDIANVKGDWGLVWDGDSIETCQGCYGMYLKYNAPYKMSLYLALGIPVIVWTESAMARYVKHYHLGVCVASLNEIYDIVSQLTESEKEVIHMGVKEFSRKVKSGEMLRVALQQAIIALEN